MCVIAPRTVVVPRSSALVQPPRRERRRQQYTERVRCVQVRATGGGAFKFTDLFRERLGVVLKKEDEIACLVQVRAALLLLR